MFELVNKDILLISPESWEHIFISKHHYATHLAKKGNRVYFLNPPSGKLVCNKTEYENVFSVQYKRFIRGIRFLPSFFQRFLIKRKFEELQKFCNAKFALIWSFDNSVFYDFSALPKDLTCISHIVDLNQDFEFEKAAKTADLCIGVIPKIVDKFKKYNSKVFNISHGVQEFPVTFTKLKLPGKNKLKSLYIGNLQMPHIDWQLFLNLAKNNKEIDFVFLGADNHNIDFSNKKRIFGLPNVFYLAQVAAHEIPNYLNSADILIYAYLSDYDKNYASPHKMMEYLASGKMIISSWNEGYANLKEESLIKMTKNQKEFISAFSQVVENLEYWNNSEKKKLRKAFANQYTYENQINRIEKIIQSHS